MLDITMRIVGNLGVTANRMIRKTNGISKRQKTGLLDGGRRRKPASLMLAIPTLLWEF